MPFKRAIAGSLVVLSKTFGPSGLRIFRKIIPLSVKRKISKFITGANSSGKNVVTAKTGHKFISIKEPVFLHILLEGEYERGLSAIARNFLRPGDTCVDIGANFGWYTILMASEVSPSGNVISIEPNPWIFDILKKNVALNSYEGLVALKNLGAGSEESSAILIAGEANSGPGYLKKSGENGDIREEVTGKEVQVSPLDKIVSEHSGKIAFVKIDVEGFEPFVFEGGRNVFEIANQPIIQLEFNVGALKRQHGDISEFVQFLNNLDSAIYAGETGKLIKIDQLDDVRNHDLFIVPNSGKFSGRNIEKFL